MKMKDKTEEGVRRPIIALLLLSCALVAIAITSQAEQQASSKRVVTFKPAPDTIVVEGNKTCYAWEYSDQWGKKHIRICEEL